jgi:hypothetical protein
VRYCTQNTVIEAFTDIEIGPNADTLFIREHLRTITLY